MEMEKGIHCFLKQAASVSKTHFGTTWGADGAIIKWVVPYEQTSIGQ